MILYTVRQTFLVLVSVFYRCIRTFFGVIAYCINYYIINSITIINNYVYYKKWWTNKRGGENLLSK